MERTLELIFATSANAKDTIRVYNARADVTAAQINAAMDNIIAKNIIDGSAGTLTGKVGARIVTRDTAEINLG
ncbi:DUF2922 domain-containing protein [Syntrophomonas palmitatica]|uniref:DUF2922 domain-containing protein n=1 Tax=Syntrophomonas palmitatica TaxID=402877 RepID=UPI0006D17303|nr:DUF2922 domain-containing protein [Syntrophomonas palmitatica]